MQRDAKGEKNANVKPDVKDMNKMSNLGQLAILIRSSSYSVFFGECSVQCMSIRDVALIKYNNNNNTYIPIHSALWHSLLPQF